MKAATLERIKQGEANQFSTRVRAPRLPALAQFIREQWPELRVTLEDSTYDTSRTVPGQRYVYAHTERTGRRLTVKDTEHKTLLEHNSAETYRVNAEVCRWILQRLGEE